MSMLLYVETRNNEVVQNYVLGAFNNDEVRDLVLRREIDLCIESGAALGVINALESWDMKSTLTYQYDTRTRRYGNWVVVS